MADDVQIRTATADDVPAMLEIYNHAVRHTVATFDVVPRTLADGEAWAARHNTRNHPLSVAVVNGTVAGYASLSPYRPMPAYDSTVELSVYIHPQFFGRGIATALMQEMLELAQADSRTHLVVSVITADNAVSRHLHEKLGFAYCGCHHEAGFKNGAYHDVVHYEKRV